MANIASGRRAGLQDFNSRGDPSLTDLGELAARITGIGLGQQNRSAAPFVIMEGFGDAASLTARWITLTPSGAVALDSKAFSGVQSVKLTPNAALAGSWCGIDRTIPAYPTKYGLDVMLGMTGGTGATQGYTVSLYQTWSPGLNLQKLSTELDIICDPTTGKYTLKIWTQSSGGVNLVTGLGLLNDPVNLFWHNVKIICDTSTGLYDKVFLDNLFWDVSQYDMQNFGVQSYDGQALLNELTMTTNDTNSKNLWVDDFIVTRDE